jgi:hypothetical protein
LSSHQEFTGTAAAAARLLHTAVLVIVAAPQLTHRRYPNITGVNIIANDLATASKK